MIAVGESAVSNETDMDQCMENIDSAFLFDRNLVMVNRVRKTERLAAAASNPDTAVARLSEHRLGLKGNVDAYFKDFPRLARNLLLRFQRMGYQKLDRRDRASMDVVRDYIFLIAKTQGFRPFFHLPEVSDGPWCWNNPEHWRLDYIVYQWGHLSPLSEGGGKDELEDLSIQSARCNSQIQTALSIDAVEQWLGDGRLKQRIQEVRAARAILFASSEWDALKKNLRSFWPTEEEAKALDDTRKLRARKRGTNAVAPQLKTSA